MCLDKHRGWYFLTPGDRVAVGAGQAFRHALVRVRVAQAPGLAARRRILQIGMRARPAPVLARALALADHLLDARALLLVAVLLDLINHHPAATPIAMSVMMSVTMMEHMCLLRAREGYRDNN